MDEIVFKGSALKGILLGFIFGMLSLAIVAPVMAAFHVNGFITFIVCLGIIIICMALSEYLTALTIVTVDKSGVSYNGVFYSFSDSEVSAPAVRTLLLKNHQHSAEC